MITWRHGSSLVQAAEEVEANIVRLLALEEELRGTLKNGAQRTAELEKIKWVWLKRCWGFVNEWSWFHFPKWMTLGQSTQIIQIWMICQYCNIWCLMISVLYRAHYPNWSWEDRETNHSHLDNLCGSQVIHFRSTCRTNLAQSHPPVSLGSSMPSKVLQGWGTGSRIENKSLDMRLYYMPILYQIHSLCERTAICITYTCE